jgi:hypothetical protein
VVAAVSELRTEYAGRVRFVVVQPEQTLSGEDVARYELGTHGLVAFDADGKVFGTLPGHDFGRAEIEALVRRMLEGEPAR